jgi:ethanolamine ammonia-lyase small subunit
MSSELDLDAGAALAARLRALTPARVGLARTGVSLATRELLDFDRCRAQARDAVQGRLEAAALAGALAELTKAGVLRLHSAATDRTTYLQRPDLGRKLDAASRELLVAQPFVEGCQGAVAIIVADGLSALAVERHAVPLIAELLPRLGGIRLAPICVVEQGRVAIGDEIGLALGAEISVVLIGERPGLSSPDSLGAYITWEPRPGKTDAERNCISNIRGNLRGGGLSYALAAVQLGYYLTEARRRRLTGVALKEQAGLELTALKPAAELPELRLKED